MKKTIVYSSIAAALIAGGAGLAVAAPADGKATFDQAKLEQARAQVAANATAAQKAAAQARLHGTRGEYFTNPSATYPPSCLQAPMLLGMYQNDPNAAQSSVLLGGDPLSTDGGETAYNETDLITVFRVVCSG